jgi:starch phosphorylase
MTKKIKESSPVEEGRGVRRGTGTDEIRQAILDHLYFSQASSVELATRNDWYMALAFAVRDRMLEGLLAIVKQLADRKLRIVSYLSSEFLMGPHLGNNLVNLGLTEAVRAAVSELGQELDDLLAAEEEPGLGNGGLGRLAACFMESLATLQVPAIGYGIRYEFGIFDKQIRDGWQM